VTIVRAPSITSPSPEGTDAIPADKALPKADATPSSGFPSLPVSAAELKALPKKLGQILGSFAK
jgi:hypothetical protein